MRKAKIASVGCGWVARRWHLPTIAELTKRGDLDYVAVCDANADTAREVGEEYGLPYYTDVEICIALLGLRWHPFNPIDDKI
ncbi:hypothetical protein C6499_11500 [Candidatus Poribacteria bacterium]|nr:MAG: hypothetical protein C6499_11500 [Candidatus Poribacteria bacterium]